MGPAIDGSLAPDRPRRVDDQTLAGDLLNKDILLHGSPASVVEKIATLRDTAGVDSVMLHYPPYYGQDKALASLELFATEVIPKFKAPAPKRKTA